MLPSVTLIYDRDPDSSQQRSQQPNDMFYMTINL